MFAGWARTVLCMDLHYLHPDPYGKEIEALDSVLPGEVVVVGTGGSKRNAPWGELLSTAAMARGARGAVVDGLIRDVKKILTLGFPVFSPRASSRWTRAAAGCRRLQRSHRMRRRDGHILAI